MAACTHIYKGSGSSSALAQEETWLQGHMLSNVLFGVQVALSVMAFSTIFQKRSLKHSRMRIHLLIFIALLFVTTTTAQGFLMNLIQMAFITQRDYPGGPSAFLNDACWVPANLASNILVVFANWMMEFLLVWRCHVVCSVGDQLWWLGVAIPSLLLFAVFVTGSLFIYHVVHATPPATFVIAYAVSSLALNFTATAFIAGRLLYLRHQIINYFGRGHGRQYVSVAAVVIESAALYTAFLVAVIVAYITGSPAMNFLQQNIEQIQSITSLLTILRIARGEGWVTATDAELALVVRSSQMEQSQIQLNVTQTELDEEEASSKANAGEGEALDTRAQMYAEVKRHVKSGTWTI